MTVHLTPLEVCEKLIGSLEVIANICGRDDKTPYSWKRASKFHEPGDFRSAGHMRRVLAYSETHGLGVTARMLIEGADETEIKGILMGRAA